MLFGLVALAFTLVQNGPQGLATLETSWGLRSPYGMTKVKLGSSESRFEGMMRQTLFLGLENYESKYELSAHTSHSDVPSRTSPC